MSLDVVFIPGFLCDDRLFAAQTRAFRDLADVESITVADIRGHSSIEAMAASILESAPSRFTVVGLSLGGIVAAELAAISPEQLTGVAVLDANLAPPDEAQLANRRRWASSVESEGVFRIVVDELIEPLTNDVVRNAPLILDMALQAGADTFLRQNEALLHRRDRRDDLASVSAPVLFACGSEDRLCPPHVHHALGARVPHARVEVVDGAGHLSTLDQPEAVSELLTTWLTACNTQHQLPTGGISNDYSNA